MNSHLFPMALYFLVAVTQALGDERSWPQFRGPKGTGVTSAAGVVSQWGPEQNVKWRIELPEPCNSTPIVWENKIFLTQPLAEANQRSLFCIDLDTGREVWRRGIDYDQPETSHKTNPYCSASPVTDGRRVIAWFGSAGLACWGLSRQGIVASRPWQAGAYVGLRVVADSARGFVHSVVRPGEQ